MNNPISFITANYVAREIGYHMTGGWAEGDSATSQAFTPLKTYAEKLSAILDDVRELGFESIDIWTAHLNPLAASEEHIAIAARLLKEKDLRIVSLAGGFGSTLDDLESCCRAAKGIGAPMLVGGLPVYAEYRDEVIAILRQHNIIWAFENHPKEKSAEDVLRVIGDDPPEQVRLAVDTGWFGTNAVDAPAALRDLVPLCVHIHLKDVRETGQHRTCALGDGVVGIEACVNALRETNYNGPIAIEHEPEDRDPTEEIKTSLARLQHWIRNGTNP